MEIYLVRHTSVAAPKGLCYGQTDVLPSEKFHDEAQIIKSKLSEIAANFDLYSSPLSRCTMLSEELYPQKTFHTDNRWMEMNFGDWESKLWNDIPMEECQPWMEDVINVSTPNGESFAQMIDRVRSVWEEILTQSPNDKVIVCHGGVIRTLLSLILEIPPQKVFSIVVDYGDVIKIKYQAGFFSVKFL